MFVPQSDLNSTISPEVAVDRNEFGQVTDVLPGVLRCQNVALYKQRSSSAYRSGCSIVRKIFLSIAPPFVQFS